MPLKLWIVFACLSAVAESKYRFRFHMCYEDDQKILEQENLISLNQVAFIDDGSLTYHNVTALEKVGIRIQGASAIEKLTNTYKPGSESALRVISFEGFEKIIVINFWSHAYYIMAKNDKYTLDGPIRRAYSDPINEIQPDLSHFVRVYFVCAPGTSRSALILFGPQATLRKKPKEKKRVARNARNATTDIQKMKQKAAADYAARHKKRLEIKEGLRMKVNMILCCVGFGLCAFINGIILFVFMRVYKSALPLKKDEKADEKPPVKSAETARK